MTRARRRDRLADHDPRGRVALFEKFPDQQEIGQARKERGQQRKKAPAIAALEEHRNDVSRGLANDARRHAGSTACRRSPARRQRKRATWPAGKITTAPPRLSHWTALSQPAMLCRRRLLDALRADHDQIVRAKSLDPRQPVRGHQRGVGSHRLHHRADHQTIDDAEGMVGDDNQSAALRHRLERRRRRARPARRAFREPPASARRRAFRHVAKHCLNRSKPNSRFNWRSAHGANPRRQALARQPEPESLVRVSFIALRLGCLTRRAR